MPRSKKTRAITWKKFDLSRPPPRVTRSQTMIPAGDVCSQIVVWLKSIGEPLELSTIKKLFDGAIDIWMVKRCLQQLKDEGIVQRVGDDHWKFVEKSLLTDEGNPRAQRQTLTESRTEYNDEGNPSPRRHSLTESITEYNGFTSALTCND